MSDTPPQDKLDSERSALARSGSLHWFHWLILATSAVVTLAAWRYFDLEHEEKRRTQFDREASQVVEQVLERMAKYEDALSSGVAAMKSVEGGMSLTQWRTFARNLQIDDKYPGINGIGYIEYVEHDELAGFLEARRLERPGFRVHPTHSQPLRLPIVYIEPEQSNTEAIGLDIAHEQNRFTAALQARDTASAQITGPIVLVQDHGQTPGFLFYAPLFNSDVVETLTQRQQHFQGLVYAPFVVKKLLEGTLDQNRRRVGIRLTDADAIIYDENTQGRADFDADPLYKGTQLIELYGRVWRFDIWSGQSFRHATHSNQPFVILVIGLVIDFLLLTLFILLSRASRRSLAFAAAMTREAQRRASALSKSNSELESFAYVASHDLKTPLRGIADLTSYLEEDLQTYMADRNANPDVRHNLTRLHGQTERMANLIRDVLEYSSVGSGNDSLGPVNVLKVISRLRTTLGIADEQLVVETDMPVFNTSKVRFEQVLANLIDNAIKYHHDPDNAVVTLSCHRRGDFWRFSVADNGPGIDERFHTRIFEVFQSLHAKDDVESTGIGLAIVKKSVESLGGKIEVHSSPGCGTTFIFEWPVEVVASPPALDLAL